MNERTIRERLMAAILICAPFVVLLCLILGVIDIAKLMRDGIRWREAQRNAAKETQ